jgi:hypothetical protein
MVSPRKEGLHLEEPQAGVFSSFFRQRKEKQESLYRLKKGVNKKCTARKREEGYIRIKGKGDVSWYERFPWENVRKNRLGLGLAPKGDQRNRICINLLYGFF